MAQLLRHCDNIGTVCQEDGGHRVAERVGIDMGQAVAGGEVVEPAGDAVRAHVVAVVLGEDVAGMLPTIAVCKLEPELFPPVLPKQVHCFLGQRQNTDVAGFGGAVYNTLAFGYYQGAVNADFACAHVNLFPLQGHDFTPAATGDDHQVGDRPPLQRLMLQGLQDRGYLFRLEVVRVFLLCPWRGSLRCCVVRYQHFLFRLGQDRGDQPVVLQDRLVCQRGGVLLYPEDFLQALAHGLGDRCGLFFADRFAPGSGADGGGGDPGSLCDRCPGLLVLLQPGRNVNAGCGAAATFADPGLCQVLVEAVQVLRAEVDQLNVADRGVDPAQQLPVPVKSTGADAGAFLQLQHILRIVCEGLPVIQGVALFDRALKVCGGPLDGLLDLPFCHTGGGLVGRPVADPLAGGIEAAGDADPVGGAGFAGNLFNRCHS